MLIKDLEKMNATQILLTLPFTNEFIADLREWALKYDSHYAQGKPHPLPQFAQQLQPAQNQYNRSGFWGKLARKIQGNGGK